MELAKHAAKVEPNARRVTGFDVGPFKQYRLLSIISQVYSKISSRIKSRSGQSSIETPGVLVDARAHKSLAIKESTLNVFKPQNRLASPGVLIS